MNILSGKKKKSVAFQMCDRGKKILDCEWGANGEETKKNHAIAELLNMREITECDA